MSDEPRNSTVSFAEMVRIKKAAEPRLFRLPGVTCVAIGFKQRETRFTEDLAITVYVEAKKPLHELAPEDVVPPFIEGIPTDVLHMGRVQPLSGPGVVPPQDDDGKVLVGGMEIVSPGHGLEHGTLGCIVLKNGDNNHHYLLTNQHVVLPKNDEGPPGGEIRVSGMGCSSCTAGRVGAVDAAHVVAEVPTELNPKKNDIYYVNVDAALVLLDPGMKWRARVVSQKESKIFDIAGDDELGDLYENFTPGLVVFKVGAKTDYQEGVIESISADRTHAVPNSSGYDIPYHEQIIIRHQDKGPRFADRGDSGSVLLRKDTNKVVGLVWGSDRDVSSDGYWRAAAIPIKAVKQILGVRIADANEFSGVRTVPPSGNAALASEPGAASAWAASAPLDTWSLRARVQAELLQTRGGQRYSQLILKHQQEVRTLVETNKRVAAVWRRSGGPFIVHHLVDAARHPDTPLPQVIEGQPLDEALRDIFDILRRHGSAALVADIEAHQERFTSLIRLSYTQLLERLRTLDA